MAGKHTVEIIELRKELAECQRCFNDENTAHAKAIFEIERLRSLNAELLEALEAVVSVKLARECKHDEEYDYCDCCKHDWEKEVEAARKLAAGRDPQSQRGVIPRSQGRRNFNEL